MKYKLSVVIPAHNRSNNIKELITKFLEINDAEIIVIENGSDKKEKKLYKNIEKEYKNQKNVKFFFNTWGSSSEARKEGVNKATARYTFFCDDDDLPTSEFIEWINNNHLTAAAYNFDIFNFINKEIQYSISNLRVGSLRKNLGVSTWISQSAILKKIFEDRNFPTHISMGEDQILSLLQIIYLKEKKMKNLHIDICSINYGINDSGQSILRGKRSISDDLKINDWLLKYQNNRYGMYIYRKMIKHRVSELKRGCYSDYNSTKREINKYKV